MFTRILIFVFYLRIAGLTLRLRWLWLKRTDPARPWAALPLEVEKEAQAMFDDSIQIDIGDGSSTMFWTDRWLNGTSIQLMPPDLCRAVNRRALKRTVREALQNRQWIRDLSTPLTIMAFSQYLQVWPSIQVIQLQEGIADNIRW